jgi:hypothetical protein
MAMRVNVSIMRPNAWSEMPRIMRSEPTILAKHGSDSFLMFLYALVKKHSTWPSSCIISPIRDNRLLIPTFLFCHRNHRSHAFTTRHFPGGLMYKDFSLEGATREEVKKEKRLQQLREKKEQRDMHKEEMEQLKRDRLYHICAFFPVSCKYN